MEEKDPFALPGTEVHVFRPIGNDAVADRIRRLQEIPGFVRRWDQSPSEGHLNFQHWPERGELGPLRLVTFGTVLLDATPMRLVVPALSAHLGLFRFYCEGYHDRVSAKVAWNDDGWAFGFKLGIDEPQARNEYMRRVAAEFALPVHWHGPNAWDVAHRQNARLNTALDGLTCAMPGADAVTMLGLAERFAERYGVGLEACTWSTGLVPGVDAPSAYDTLRGLSLPAKDVYLTVKFTLDAFEDIERLHPLCRHRGRDYVDDLTLSVGWFPAADGVRAIVKDEITTKKGHKFSLGIDGPLPRKEIRRLKEILEATAGFG